MVTLLPDVDFNRLNEMLAASKFGMINRFAEPLKREFEYAKLRMFSSNAASACISPSTSSSGAICDKISNTLRIFCALGSVWSEPKLE